MKREQVKKAARQMAEEIGLVNITRAGLSRRVGISEGSFAHHVGCGFSQFIEEVAAEVPIGRAHKSKKSRANPALRHQQLLQVALQLAETHGYAQVTRGQIAAAAGVAPGLVSHYLGSISATREAILGEAIRAENLAVIAQGVLAKSHIVAHVDEKLKRRAVRAAMTG